ncbi:MAG: aminotransferase class IV [Saprospiraceae bacterium]
MHNQRCNASRKSLFGMHRSINLKNYIRIPYQYAQGLVKCRIVYSENVETVHFENYNKKSIEKIKIVRDDDITYDHKYLDRKIINDLYAQKGEADEIIISRAGFVTDASIYNLVFQTGNQYFTSSHPLLKGTRRNHLLNSGKILEAPINESDLLHYDYIHFVNALTPLGDLKLPLRNNIFI